MQLVLLTDIKKRKGSRLCPGNLLVERYPRQRTLLQNTRNSISETLNLNIFCPPDPTGLQRLRRSNISFRASTFQIWSYAPDTAHYHEGLNGVVAFTVIG